MDRDEPLFGGRNRLDRRQAGQEALLLQSLDDGSQTLWSLQVAKARFVPEVDVAEEKPRRRARRGGWRRAQRCPRRCLPGRRFALVRPSGRRVRRRAFGLAGNRRPRGGNRLVERTVDRQQGVETGDGEHLRDARLQSAERDRPLSRANLLGDQQDALHAGAADVVEVAEVEDQVPGAVLETPPAVLLEVGGGAAVQVADRPDHQHPVASLAGAIKIRVLVHEKTFLVRYPFTGQSKVTGTLRVPSAEAETGIPDGTRSVPGTFQTVNGYLAGHPAG